MRSFISTFCVSAPLFTYLPLHMLSIFAQTVSTLKERGRCSFTNFGFNVGDNRYGIQTGAGDNASGLAVGMTRHVGTDAQISRELNLTWTDEYAIFNNGRRNDDGSREIVAMHGDQEISHRLDASKVEAIVAAEDALQKKKANAAKAKNAAFDVKAEQVRI